MSESDVAVVIQKILQVLYYIHGQGVIHRDLRPENLLLKKGADFTDVKITGFKPMQKMPSQASPRGSPKNMADYFKGPETFGNAFYTAKEDDPKKDIWSVGIIAVLLLTGKLDKKHRIGQVNFQGEEWKDISKGSKNFIR